MAKRILIVDDEEDLCESLAEELTDSGYETVYVTTGEAALEKIEAELWDMALVDLKLATKITGLKVMEALQERRPETLLVAISGYEDIGLRQKVEKLGAKDFFRKPNDTQMDVLTGKVGTLFERYGT